MAAEGGVPAVAVFGSATCDLLLGVEALPRAGETVLSKEGYVLAGGGKGANQACAAACAGAAVEMVACVGRDQFAEVALGNLRRRGVRVAARESDDGVPTALAMVACSTATGENQIIVVAGANMCLRASDFEGTSEALAEARKDPTRPWAVLLQSEVPPEENWAVAAAAHAAGAFVLLNNAPTARVPREVYRHLDMLAVNEVEVEQMLRFMGILVEELRVQDSAQSRGVVTALGCTSDATASRAIEAGRCLYIATSVTVCLTLGEHGGASCALNGWCAPCGAVASASCPHAGARLSNN